MRASLQYNVQTKKSVGAGQRVCIPLARMFLFDYQHFVNLNGREVIDL
jgi:hypothetical protein